MSLTKLVGHIEIFDKLVEVVDDTVAQLDSLQPNATVQKIDEGEHEPAEDE